MPSYAIDGLILRGTLRDVSTYSRTRDNKPMLGLKVLVDGEEYRAVQEVSIPAAGIVVPEKGDTVEVEVAVRVTKDGSQYLTAYDGGLRVLDADPAGGR